VSVTRVCRVSPACRCVSILIVLCANVLYAIAVTLYVLGLVALRLTSKFKTCSTHTCFVRWCLMSENTALQFNRSLRDNKLSGAIPGTLTLLTVVNSFGLGDNPKLCRLDAASTAVTTKCTPLTTACPYPTCACTDLATCPSGAQKSSSAAVKLVTPFYPADDTACCPMGTSLSEQLVTDGHLDCTVGRPCVATTGTSGKGTMAIVL
jgi:hypothetical protein